MPQATGSGDLASRLMTATTPIPDSFFSTLITANHILHAQGIVDAYGHVSARSPQDSSVFFLAKSSAPALVSRRDDLLAYHVSSGDPVVPQHEGVTHYLERFIHSELYKRFPGVRAVVHAHSEPVLPFGVTSVPLRPVWHMGAAAGAVIPVYDVALHYSGAEGERGHDLLVSNTRLGATLAAGFASPSDTSFLGRTSNALKSLVSSPTTSSSDDGQTAAGVAGRDYPTHEVLLMRGHGFTAAGASVEEAVYRAVYTVANARVQRDAVLLQGAWNTAVAAERVAHVGKEGYAGGDKEGSTRVGAVSFLSDREAREAWHGLKGQVGRPWELWAEEIKHCKLYSNE